MRKKGEMTIYHIGGIVLVLLLFGFLLYSLDMGRRVASILNPILSFFDDDASPFEAERDPFIKFVGGCMDKELDTSRFEEEMEKGKDNPHLPFPSPPKCYCGSYILPAVENMDIEVMSLTPSSFKITVFGDGELIDDKVASESHFCIVNPITKSTTNPSTIKVLGEDQNTQIIKNRQVYLVKYSTNTVCFIIPSVSEEEMGNLYNECG
ncbi:hypothetical protein ACFLZX_01645 [Nanoarchaeota archaeon]